MKSKKPAKTAAKNQEPLAEITCNIQKSNTTGNQLIYCSQLYNTFFAVSAKLNIKNGILKTMKLTLINYKGLFNIGMLNDTKTAFKLEGNGATLTLHLKANAGKHGSGKGKQIIVDCKNTAISTLTDLTVTRELHKLSNKGKEDHLEEGLFDSEFYQRDGALVLDLERLDDHEPLTRKDRCKTTKSNFV